MAYFQRLTRVDLVLCFVSFGMLFTGCARSHVRLETDAATDTTDMRSRDVDLFRRDSRDLALLDVGNDVSDLGQDDRLDDMALDSRLDLAVLDAGNDASDLGLDDMGPDSSLRDAGSDSPDAGSCAPTPVPLACHGTYERGAGLGVGGHSPNAAMVRTPTGWAWLAWAPSHESYEIVRTPHDLSSLTTVPLEGVPWMFEGDAYVMATSPTVRSVRSTGEWLIRLETRMGDGVLIGLWDLEGNLLVAPRPLIGPEDTPFRITETGYIADEMTATEIRTTQIDLTLAMTQEAVGTFGPIDRGWFIWRGCDWLLWSTPGDASDIVFSRLSLDGTLSEPIPTSGIRLPAGAMSYRVHLFETGPVLLVAFMPDRTLQVVEVDPHTGEALGEFFTVVEPSESASVIGWGTIVREGDSGYGIVFDEVFHLRGQRWLIRFRHGEVVQRILLPDSLGHFRWLQWRDDAYIVGYLGEQQTFERLRCVP